MSDLETLKCDHPEWCFNCGALFRDQYEVEHHHDANMCPWRDPNMAMLALLQQHEATIAEMKANHPHSSCLALIARSERAEADLRVWLAKREADLAEAQATIQQRERELEEAHDILRSLASWVGNGGYNAPSVDVKQFEAKIRDGVDFLIRVEVNRALSDADTRAHAWWAHTGPHKSLREAIHNGEPAWVRHSARAQQESEAKKEE